jgi:hypothetical protein
MEVPRSARDDNRIYPTFVRCRSSRDSWRSRAPRGTTTKADPILLYCIVGYRPARSAGPPCIANQYPITLILFSTIDNIDSSLVSRLMEVPSLRAGRLTTIQIKDNRYNNIKETKSADFLLLRRLRVGDLTKCEQVWISSRAERGTSVHRGTYDKHKNYSLGFLKIRGLLSCNRGSCPARSAGPPCVADHIRQNIKLIRRGDSH